VSQSRKPSAQPYTRIEFKPCDVEGERYLMPAGHSLARVDGGWRAVAEGWEGPVRTSPVWACNDATHRFARVVGPDPCPRNSDRVTEALLWSAKVKFVWPVCASPALPRPPRWADD